MDDTPECPLCMETLELDDVNFYPCSCGYQICRFCWHRIRTDENGLCPACRKPYSENPAEYTPLTQEQIQKVKNSKRQKNQEKRQKVVGGRKHLSELRVVQRNLVFVIGLSPRLADSEVLKKPEYFGKFGRIHKVVVNNTNVYPGPQGPSMGAYITYYKNEDAARAIQNVNDTYIDGRFLKASFGTTKYCSNFLKNQSCHKPDCMYLHEVGEEEASFTKEDMQMGKHQTFETMALAQVSKELPNARNRQKDQELEVVQGIPAPPAVMSSFALPSSTTSNSTTLSSAGWGESEGKSVGKKNGKISHHNQTGAKAVEMEINSGTSHQQQQHEQDSGDHEVTHNNTEHEAVQQGNGSSSVHVSGSPSVSDSSVHVHDSLPYGVACPVHPVQQLFADMAQLSLHVSSGALQQQIRHHEQKQRVQTHAESDVDDDDALLRDAVDAGQISNNQTVERHETQDVVSLEQRSNVRHIENGIDGSVNGQIHRTEKPSWSWSNTIDHLRRSCGNEDDLEFDPYGESAKALAELMEAETEKLRVMRSIRETLREQDEEGAVREQRVPLWKRKGSYADGTDQAETPGQSSQAGVLRLVNHGNPLHGGVLRPCHTVVSTTVGQYFTQVRPQQEQPNGVWPNRHQKLGDGLLIQGTVGATVPPHPVHVQVGRNFVDHLSPKLNNSSHMPGLPNQHYMWPDMTVSTDSLSQSTPVMRGPTSHPGTPTPIPPFHAHTVYGLPSCAPTIGAVPGNQFSPIMDTQRPRIMTRMNVARQEGMNIYSGPQHMPPFVQQTVRHQHDTFIPYPGMHGPHLGAVRTVQPSVGIRPPPGIHMKPENTSAVPYFVPGISNPMDHNSGLVNGTLPHNP